MALSKQIQYIITMCYSSDFEISYLINELEDCKEQAEDLEQEIKDLTDEIKN